MADSISYVRDVSGKVGGTVTSFTDTNVAWTDINVLKNRQGISSAEAASPSTLVRSRGYTVGARGIACGGKSKPWWEGLGYTVIEISVTDDDLTFTESSAFFKGTQIWWDANGDKADTEVKTSSTAITHTYAQAGTYVVVFSDVTTSLQGAFANRDNVIRLLSVGSKVANLYQAFWKCTSLVSIPSDLSWITTWYGSFAYTKINYDLELLVKDGVNLKTTFFSVSYLTSITVHGAAYSVGAAGQSLTRIVALDALSLQSSQSSTLLESVYAPNAISTEGNTFYACYNLRSVQLGTVTSLGSGLALRLVGSSVGGCTVTVGNTMDSLMGLTNWPWSAPTTTKFVCADGYITYESGAWTQHATA